MLRIGIVGLGRAGKSTLFQILTRAHGSGQTTGHFGAQVGVVHVPDTRLSRLAEIYRPRKTTYASLEYLDPPGSVVELARKGTQAATLRETDALAHVVRAFGEPSVEAGSTVDPRRDIENVELELILSDLAVTEKRLERLERDLKKQKNPALEKEYQALLSAKSALEKQSPLREIKSTVEEERLLRGFAFLSLKPMLYVLNLDEKDAARAAAVDEVADSAGIRRRARTAVTAVCGKIEAELAELDDQQAAEFLASYGLKESATARLVRSSYRLLGLISFFTVGEVECRAWTIRAGATALEAAGEIHSDFHRGFIRAEVVQFEDLIAAGSLAEARQRGLAKAAGKDYVVQDGEVVYIRHSG